LIPRSFALIKSDFRRTMTSPHGPYGVGYRRATRMFTK
jgi:hypothetical protein